MSRRCVWLTVVTTSPTWGNTASWPNLIKGDLSLMPPASLMALPGAFRPLFTAPSFRTFSALAAGFLAQTGRRTFSALAAGFLAQTGRRTVCGMLTGAGLSQVWRHDRAHRFFAHAGGALRISAWSWRS